MYKIRQQMKYTPDAIFHLILITIVPFLTFWLIKNVDFTTYHQWRTMAAASLNVCQVKVERIFHSRTMGTTIKWHSTVLHCQQEWMKRSTFVYIISMNRKFYSSYMAALTKQLEYIRWHRHREQLSLLFLFSDEWHISRHIFISFDSLQSTAVWRAIETKPVHFMNYLLENNHTQVLGIWE